MTELLGHNEKQKKRHIDWGQVALVSAAVLLVFALFFLAAIGVAELITKIA